MNTAITFRTATADDVEILADLRIRFAQELSDAPSATAIAALRDSIAAYFRRAAADGSCISILAESGAEPVGIGSAHLREVPGSLRNPSGRWGYIMNMYTVPAFRKQGICAKILALLQERAAEAGAAAFELHATELGKPVYLQDGFKIHSEPTLRKVIGKTAAQP